MAVSDGAGFTAETPQRMDNEMNSKKELRGQAKTLLLAGKSVREVQSLTMLSRPTVIQVRREIPNLSRMKGGRHLQGIKYLSPEQQAENDQIKMLREAIRALRRVSNGTSSDL